MRILAKLKGKYCSWCEAENCKYNNNQKCEAGNISIEGSYALSEIQTECATFSSKIDK